MHIHHLFTKKYYDMAEVTSKVFMGSVYLKEYHMYQPESGVPGLSKSDVDPGKYK